MKISLDVTRLNRAVKNTRQALNTMKEKNEKLTKNFVKNAEENLRYIAVTEIDKFYEDYEPHSYDRTFDLYNAYRISVTPEEWRIDFDSSFMQEWHRVDEQDPEYIFENSFMRGWHGGAISGMGHPNPGIPYWRLPNKKIETATGGYIKTFSETSPWVFSLMSPSPYKQIARKSNLYMKIETEKYKITYNENIDKFLRQAKWNLERIK